MTGINWAQKLGSRKFWALVAALITALLVLFRVDAEASTQIVALVGAFGSVVMYMLAEASVDRARAEAAGNDTPAAVLREASVGVIKKDPEAQTPYTIKPPDVQNSNGLKIDPDR
jgi:hypothetical protein